MNNPCCWMQDEFCANADCPMCTEYCPVPDTPDVCKHEDRTPEWTAQEVANAKTILRLLPEAKILHCGMNDTIALLTETRRMVTPIINAELFPSIRAIGSVSLQKIIESEKGDKQNG